MNKKFSFTEPHTLSIIFLYTPVSIDFIQVPEKKRIKKQDRLCCPVSCGFHFIFTECFL